MLRGYGLSLKEYYNFEAVAMSKSLSSELSHSFYISMSLTFLKYFFIIISHRATLSPSTMLDQARICASQRKNQLGIENIILLSPKG